MCKMPKNDGKSIKTLGCCTLGTEDHTESGIKTKLQTTFFAFITVLSKHNIKSMEAGKEWYSKHTVEFHI